ncbi:MAG: prepilin-type N-terminal cleavage/methylation domain-containing protein [Patescibacteria group bacterium]|jgi:type II secretion system protein G
MNKKGFTLMELLIVIMILGVLAALITGNFFTSLKKGRDAKRKGDLEQIQRALEMYYEDKKAYPSALVFESSLSDPISGKVYMQKVPNDPLSEKDYEYLSTDGSDYKIFACLENKLQQLTYISSGYTTTSMTSCGPCRNLDNTADVDHCVWGVSSSNISP